MEIIISLIYIAVFLYSVVLHEIAHGFVANKFGDDTAKTLGRLSLNPIIHIDPVGSILVPALLFFSQTGFMFGWAKPVPVNPHRLQGGKMAYRWVTLAGIGTNLALAITGAIVLKVAIEIFGYGSDNLGVVFFTIVVQINLVLAIFNLMPLPGFDGWNFLSTFDTFASIVRLTPLANPMFMAQYGFLISIVLVFLFMPVISGIFLLIFSSFGQFFGI